MPVLLRRPLPDVRSRRVAGLGRRLWTGWKGVLLLQSSILRHRGFCPHTVGKIRDIGEGVIVNKYGDLFDEIYQHLIPFQLIGKKIPGTKTFRSNATPPKTEGHKNTHSILF